MSSESEESDLEVRTVTFNKSGKPKTIPDSPTSSLLVRRNVTPQGNKPPVKHMVNQALIELHTRKGVSLYAIKKYMEERFEINSDKMNFFIKKYIKKSVENGTIIQTKGIGASGSFRIVPIKEAKKVVKKKKEDKIMEPKKKMNEKPKAKISKNPKMAEKPNIVKVKKAKTVAKVKESHVEVVAKPKKMKKAENGKKVEVQKDAMKKTPMKKKNKIIKRKSIGSIIKKPKMKPKAITK